MERCHYIDRAGVQTEQWALRARELGHTARARRYRCQLANIPIEPEFELTCRCQDGSVTVCGSRARVELAQAGGRRCAR